MTWDNYLQIGEFYEEHDQLRQAHRWLTMPLTYADADDEGLDYLLLVARLRVREALELPVTGSTSARSRSSKCVAPSLIDGPSQKTSMRAP